MADTTDYARELNCDELEQQVQAEARIDEFVNTDDLDKLDLLCIKAQHAMGQRLDPSEQTVWNNAVIRDLTICLGNILTRYFIANWVIFGHYVEDEQQPVETWTLLLHADEGHYTLHLQEYVTDRFHHDDPRTFEQFVESCICRMQHVPGAYLGGYGPINHNH